MNEILKQYGLGTNEDLEVLTVMSNSCDPMDCSPPRSSLHGILQARILEWVAIS